MLEWPLVGRESLVRRLTTAMNGAAGSVEIIGDVGVGKTRLASELEAVLRADGRAVAWASGSRPASAIPFAALSQLLRIPGRSVDEPGLLHALLDELRAMADDRGPLTLFVDDAHLLDDHSATLIHLAVTHRAATVALTVRAGEPLAPGFTQLWKDGLLERVEVGALERAACVRLAASVLGGPVDSATSADLWHRSGGNALFLREMILGGIESGALNDTDHVWRSTGAARPSSRLTELVGERLDRLDETQWGIVDALAIGGPLDASWFESDARAASLEGLEKRRIVVVVTSGNRAVARLSHPLYAEVVMTAMPRTRARRVMRTLADDLERTGVRRRDDALRLALWRLDGGGPVDAVVLLQAAGTALGSFDAPLAERLARAALSKDGGVAAALLLGRALAAQERVEAADEALRRAAIDVASDGEAAQVALARADLLYFRAGRIDEATGVLLEALERVTDLDWRDELQALLILFRAGAGQLFEVAESGRRIIARTDARPRTVVHTLVYSSIADVMLGRFREADEHIRVALDLAPAVADELPLSGDLLHINQAMSDAYAGRIDAALGAGREGHRRTLDSGSTELIGLWSMTLAEMHMLAGDIDVALRTMLEGLVAARESDPFGVRGIAASLGSVFATWLGRNEQAAALYREVVDAGLARDVRSRICFDRATVWTMWLDGDAEGAANAAVDRGRAAANDTHLVWAAWLLHDAVRLGYPAVVVDPLEALADGIEGDLVPTMALHARAMVNDDPVALERIASTFDGLGCRLLAAEAAAHAQRAYVHHGRERLARIAGARASLIATACPGVKTPPLAEATSVSLTRRELEIARLAGTGMTSRAVGERLEISVRTVDNHLGMVYSKLAISGRGDLPGVLGITAE